MQMFADLSLVVGELLPHTPHHQSSSKLLLKACPPDYPVCMAFSDFLLRK
jgi:hypothetical protein